MNPLRVVPLLAASLLIAEHAGAQGKWTIGGSAGISTGNETAPSLGWWGSIHRWTRVARGTESTSPYYPNFSGLARGSQELQHLSCALQLRAMGSASSGPFVSFGGGAYRQVIRNPEAGVGIADPRANLVHPGFCVGLGASGHRGLSPGAELRYEWVASTPGPSSYITAAVILQLDH
jgi:hypothetical protein